MLLKINMLLLLQKENINTIPNILTLGRILCTPVIGYLVVADSFTWALGLFVCAGITDMVRINSARIFFSFIFIGTQTTFYPHTLAIGIL